MNNETIARAFFSRWAASFDEMCRSFDDTLAPECRWDQRPLALTVGTRDAIRFLEKSRKLMGLATIDVDVLKIAATGDSVLCERVDHLHRKNGNIIASAPVVGVLQFQTGRIVHWREYYDAIDLLRQVCANAVKNALK